MKGKVFCISSSRTEPYYVLMAGINRITDTYHLKRTNSQYFTLEYLIDGKEKVVHDGIAYDVGKGDMYLFMKGTDHEYFSSGEDYWTKIWINISGPLVEDMVRDYGLSKQVVFRGADVYDYFKRFLSVCRSDSPASEVNLKCAIIFHELLQELLKSQEQKTVKSLEAYVMKDYIDMHISENINLELLSSVVYKSRSQEIRVFKSEFKCTPYEYLLSQRFRQAKLLLSSTNLLIKEIAGQIGFPNEHYFSILFKKKYGLTPMEYRRKKSN